MANEFEAWIGREEERCENIRANSVAAMAATLDLAAAPGEGHPLPPGWQWLYFNPAVRRGSLGVDGHPAKGGFLPPIALPRRMWAGSRIQYLADLPIGADATKSSKILKIEQKSGKRGSLCFVTVEHTIRSGGVVRIVEDQDIVYRDPQPPGAVAAAPERYEGEPHWSEAVTPDPVLLFRYSALTFNGHRIHYDQSYARGEEGYPELVVHGPLTATLLQLFAQKHGGGRRMMRFDFRSVNPLFVSRAFTLEGCEGDGATLSVWARGPDGDLAMSATAGFA